MQDAELELVRRQLQVSVQLLVTAILLEHTKNGAIKASWPLYQRLRGKLWQLLGLPTTVPLGLTS